MVVCNRHETHYRIFCLPLLLPPSHIKHSPHHLALKNPQCLFFSPCKTPKFTPTQYDRHNFSIIDEYKQHSALNGSKYCLNLSCSFSLRSWSVTNFVKILHILNQMYNKVTAVLHKQSDIKYKLLNTKDCSKSIPHSPTLSLIQITLRRQKY